MIITLNHPSPEALVAILQEAASRIQRENISPSTSEPETEAPKGRIGFRRPLTSTSARFGEDEIIPETHLDLADGE